jgi:NitT/TauT family transport system ATP-binding protein
MMDGSLSPVLAVTTPKISLQRLTVAFGSSGETSTPVLENITLDIPAGQFVSILGPSGCGKSTLLRVLSGLVPASSGRVQIDGATIMEPPPQVGFMFQRDTLLPWANVEDNIHIGAELSGKKVDRAAIATLIMFLGLAGFEKHLPHQLSGGMRQRVALGRLLAYEPELYLMDEPFGALDAQTKSLMGRELLRIWAAYRRSVVFVTHDIEEAVMLSDRVIVLSSRPGLIALDLPIALDRPRDVKTLRVNPAFTSLCQTLWDVLDLAPH